MKAKIHADFECPQCGGIMYPTKGYIVCKNEDCKLCDKKFEYPAVELKEKKD